MNELMQELNVENLIYEIRGKQVMLDSDLAKLYKCANGTKTINLAVNRHHDRFPNDFYFQLNEDEINDTRLRFQFETLNKKGNLRGKHIKYLPYVFTEQGVAMLATVLRTPIAAQVSINIMRAFVKMRHYINYNKILLPNRILLLEDKIDNKEQLEKLLEEINSIDKNKTIYYNETTNEEKEE